jgi:predicted MFS family arabinose efflux permease
VVPESKASHRSKRFDFAGAATLTGGLLLLIFTLGQATIVGWNTARTIGSLAGVGALIIAFLVIESTIKEPMIPLRIFRLRTMAVANMAAWLVFGTFGAMFFFFSLFMQQAFGYSPLHAGVAYLPLAGCVALGATIASQMITKVNARPVLLTGLIMVTAALLWLARVPTTGTYPPDLLPAFLVVGVGCGMCYVTLQVAAFTGITGEQAGIGAGLIATAQDGGSAIGVAIASTIAYTGLAAKLATAHGNVFLIRTAQGAANHRAFLFAACYCFAAVVLAALLMPRVKRARGVAAGTGPISAEAPAVPVTEPQPR